MSDWEQGDLLAQEGMARAEAAANSAWLRACKQTVRDLALSGELWTTDQVWYRLELLGLSTSEPRALGSVIRAAAKAGLIASHGYRPTTRPEAHARPVPIWKGTGRREEAA